MKKKSTVLLVFVSFLIFTGLATQKPSADKKNIDLTTVNSIDILKAFRPPDTTTCVWKRLTKEQMKLFVDKWNGTTDKELKKYITTFKVAVYFKNNTIREFRVNGQYIKENADWSLDFKDKGYFEKLYLEAPLKNAH
jgi:hypothetical protein